MDPNENQNNRKFEFNAEMNDRSYENKNSEETVPKNLISGNLINQ